MERNYRWSYGTLVKHRVQRLRGALERRDEEYLKERQQKLSRVIRRSFFSEAKITFSERETE